MNRASAVQDWTFESLRGDLLFVVWFVDIVFENILLAKVCFDAKKRNIAV